MAFLTPDEAYKQTCPLIRWCVNQSVALNYNVPAIYEHQNCQGPDCKIGWRWAPFPRIGYCGAFGKPENNSI